MPLLTEQQLFEEFCQYAPVTANDGSPYLDIDHALRFVAECQKNDLAVLGIDGHVADPKERRLEPRDDLIADFSRIEESSWNAFRDRANALAEDFLLQYRQEPDLLFEFVLWSEAEREQAPQSGVEAEIGTPDEKNLRFSNKMIKLLPRRGWTVEEVVNLVGNPAARREPTVDQRTMPVSNQGRGQLGASRRTLNPWVSMWTKPRATIQQIVEHNPKRLVLVLAAITGFINSLDRASMSGLGDNIEWPTIVLLAAVFGPIPGIALLYIAGWLLRWTGKWIGGMAPSENIRAAIAWSNVPVIWASLLWIPELALFGQELFTTETPGIGASPILAFLWFGFGAIQVTVSIWYLVVLLKCLGQVQGFSAWKALGNLFLAVLPIALPLILIGVGLRFIG